MHALGTWAFRFAHKTPLLAGTDRMPKELTSSKEGAINSPEQSSLSSETSEERNAVLINA